MGTAVLAEPIVLTAAGDIVVDEQRASGTPAAVDLSSTGGNIDVTVGEATGVSSDPDMLGDIVNLSAAGSINGAFDTIVGTGTGNIRAVDAHTTSGDISISVGTVTMDGFATGGVQAVTDSGDVTLTADTVTLNGTGIDPNYEGYPDGLVAISRNGGATVVAGDVSTSGQYGSAAAAIGTTFASITLDSAFGTSDQSVIVVSRADGDASVVAGSVIHTGNGAAVESLSGMGDAMADIGNIEAGGLGIYMYANQGTATAHYDQILSGRSSVVIVDSQKAVVTADAGSSAHSTDRTAIFIDNTVDVDVDIDGSVSAEAGLSSAVWVSATGEIAMDIADVKMLGAGAEPGAGTNGMRIPQGGVIVNGSEGAVDLALGSVEVEGDYRYGVHVAANGPVNVSVDDASLASADSVAVVVRGGAGDVSITTGTVTTTGASGVGVYGNTTTGNIAIDAGTTRVENTGLQGPFTGDAVVAISDNGGDVSVISDNAFSAALYGTAVAAIGGNVTLDSNIAETTGDGGVAIYAYSSATGATVTLNAAETTTAGANSRALGAYSISGDTKVTVGNLTATNDTGQGIYARGINVAVNVEGAVDTRAISLVGLATSGELAINVGGSITSALDIGVSAVADRGEVMIGEGGSVDAERAGVVLTNFSQTDAGFLDVRNHGTIAGSVGIYVNPNQSGIAPNVFIYNDGTLTGKTTGYSVITGAGDDVLELTENSIVDGVADLGEGYDILALGLNDGVTTDAVGQVAATENVEHLSVSSGTWLADTGNSVYESVAIDEGSRLILTQDNQLITVMTPFVQLDGTLDIMLTTDSEPGELSGLEIVGGGSVHLTGPATLLVDDAVGLGYTGGTFVENGTLLLTDVFDGDIETSGTGTFQLGVGGTAGDYTGDLENNGRFVFNRSDDYTMTGAFSGTGALDKMGDGTLYFGGIYDFTGITTVFGGAIGFTGTIAEDTELALEGDGIVDLSQVDGGEATVAELSGDGGVLELGDIALTIDQDSDTVFGGSITGDGTVIKDGDGDLKLAGDSDFTGEAQVAGGTLSVNGDYSMASFTALAGGTLGGAGTIGDTTIAGGTFAPGNSIDTITVAGDLSFTADSVFEVEANAAGMADRIEVTGTATLGGATVAVLAEDGAYAPFTDYVILTADGGVDGTFGNVTSSLAFLDPELSYTDTEVMLRLLRNDIDFSSYGATTNQAAIGSLIEGLGFGNALYDTALFLDRDSVAANFETLTGEVYPGFGAAIIEAADLVRRQTDDAMIRGQGGAGTFFWASAVQGQARGKSAGYRDVDINGVGALAGFGYGSGAFSASIGGGKVIYTAKGGELSDPGMTMLVAQLGYGGQAGLTAKAGAQFGWADAKVSRKTQLGSISDSLRAEIDGTVRQYYGEVGYKALIGSDLSIEPFAGIRRIEFDADDVKETGGVTALSINEFDRKATFVDIGARIASETVGAVAPYASANWRRASGDRDSTAAVAFASGGTDGIVSALPIDKSAVQISGGVAYRTGRLEASFGYDGSFSDTFDSHGVKAQINVAF